MSQEAHRVWQEALNRVRRDVLRPSFETWLRNSQAVGLDTQRGQLTVAVPHEFARTWVQENYATSLEEALSEIVGDDAHLDLIVQDEGNHEPEDDDEDTVMAGEVQSPERANGEKAKTPSSALNRRYTFANFVVGSSNRLAHAASLAVAQAPAKAYNPLFIYGGAGLGKTHLMQAIAHRVMENSPKDSVVYVSSERFANELINSIRDTKTVNFRNRYRNVDVLLVDDIQFLAGKERTQEEFFHTFNALHEANRQIVISSDRPPKEIPTLEERLRSRFEWGLISDIQPPDLETRIAILQKRAAAESLNIADEILRYVAENITSNIRELEGALTRLVFFSSLRQQHIDMGLAEEALRDILPNRRSGNSVTVKSIQEYVSGQMDVSVSEINGRRRTQAVAYARQVAMFLARELTDASLPQIGKEFGGRDHSTVIHACNKIKDQAASDPSVAAFLEDMRGSLKSSF